MAAFFFCVNSTVGSATVVDMLKWRARVIILCVAVVVQEACIDVLIVKKYFGLSVLIKYVGYLSRKV